MTPEQIRALVLDELQKLDGDQLANALSSGVLDFSGLRAEVLAKIEEENDDG